MATLIEQAAIAYEKNFPMEASFQRALFLSWYCSKGDCSFCYMSTQKDRIRDPKKARRRMSSVYAEAIIADACGWGIEFLSGGYESFTHAELVRIVRNVYNITGKKQWLNIGVMGEGELKDFLPYAEGFAGTVECINPVVRKKVCPSKPMEPILEAFDACENLGLKKAITIIIGLGETIDDFPLLEEFIRKKGIDRITFYALNPHPGTPFKESPKIDYYERWIAMTRIAFPKLEIVAGAWLDKIDYFSRLLLAGANDMTKLPAMKMFGSKKAEQVEEQVKMAGREFKGTLTKLPGIDMARYLKNTRMGEILRRETERKLEQYIHKMKR